MSKPVVLHLPDDFHQRLQRCAQQQGSGSVATLIMRLLVSHVACHETMQAMQEFADQHPAPQPKPEVKPLTASPWLITDQSYLRKNGGGK
jgi:hypothetical protein